MKNLSKFSVKKPITIIMGVLIAILIGIVSLTNLTTDLFPSMNFPYAVVSTTYIGASPEEVEKVVSKPIEQAVSTVSNIETIKSVSKDNVSIVILKFNEDTNMDSAIVEIREQLDIAASLMPKEVSSSYIKKLNPDMMPVMVFSMSIDNKNIGEMTEILNNEIMPRIERVKGVSTVVTEGDSNNVVSVKIKGDLPDHIKNNINFNMINQILKGQNFNMPNGYVNFLNNNYLVRTGDKFNNIDDIKNLVISNNSNNIIKLGQIADVEIIDISKNNYSKVNGKDAITISVNKQNSFSTTNVSKALLEEFKELEKDYPGLLISVVMDQGEYIDIVVGSVVNNLIIGGILAILILLLFLRDLKPTIIVGLAIPISIISAFILIYFFGITMNIVSMGGLALGIGMLVDNSIVVIENIYRLRSKGYSMKDAAIEGSKGVAGAITASTLTTICVFLPIIFMKGITAQIFKELALTVTFSLLASLIIALSLVPMMASKMLKKEKNPEHKILNKLIKVYEKIVRKILNHRIVTLVILVLLFSFSTFLVLNKGMEFIPESESSQLIVNVTMKDDISFLEKTKELDSISSEIKKIKGVKTVSSSISTDSIRNIVADKNIAVYVVIDKNSKVKSNDIIKQIKESTKKFDSEISVGGASSSMSVLVGNGVEISIRGNDLKVLEKITKDVYDIVKSVDGTKEINNGLETSLDEIKITVDKDKSIKYGLTTAQIYMAVREKINVDYNASSIMINGVNYDINVYPNKLVSFGIDDISNLNIKTPFNTFVKVSDVATVKLDKGFSSISRENQSRQVTLTASIDDSYNVTKVNDKINEKLNNYKLPKGYSFVIGGESSEINSSMHALFLALVLAVVLIYMVMASQFESLLSPFIVMFTIPLALTGTFMFLLITSTKLSIVAMIGMIVLAGVVVNNGIVLVDYINQLVIEGMSIKEASIKAGKVRLRPILMTAITTILALSTMALGVGEGSEMMAPMAIATIGGLIYATLLTPIIIPVIYTLIHKDK